MNELVQNLESAIERAINDILIPKNGEQPNYNVDVLIEVIKKFVIKDGVTTSENDRYEVYYQLLGKAVAITQGWLINFAQDIKKWEDTQASIEKYITQTYSYSFSK